MRIAKEGYRLILTAALVALLGMAAGWKWLALVGGLFAFVFSGFFRDPERAPPPGEGLILSPADGRIVGIKQGTTERPFEGAETRVSIFLSPLDVHINRAPVRGRVEEVQYRKGSFFAAYKEEASENNEKNTLRIVGPKGKSLGVTQIAGVLARRIICYVKQGDVLEPGQRFGMIMFGSRVDLFLPGGTRVDVVKGQRVRGGETIIGRFS